MLSLQLSTKYNPGCNMSNGFHAVKVFLQNVSICQKLSKESPSKRIRNHCNCAYTVLVVHFCMSFFAAHVTFLNPPGCRRETLRMWLCQVLDPRSMTASKRGCVHISQWITMPSSSIFTSVSFSLTYFDMLAGSNRPRSEVVAQWQRHDRSQGLDSPGSH